MKSSSSFRLLKDKNSLLITNTISSRRSSAYWKTFLRCSRRLIRKSEWKVEMNRSGGRVSKNYTQIRNPPAGISASKKLLSEWFYEGGGVLTWRRTGRCCGSPAIEGCTSGPRFEETPCRCQSRGWTSNLLSRLLQVRNGSDRLKQVERFLLQVSSWLGEKLE